MLVHLSNIYSDLRGDTSGVKNEDSAQGFVRSTTKYWVRTQDATSVKHHILQHLPVSLFKKDNVSPPPPFWSPRPACATLVDLSRPSFIIEVGTPHGFVVRLAYIPCMFADLVHIPR